MTNMLAVITLSFLITNTETIYPTHQEPAPCPEGILGCLVYHTKTVPDANPTNREIRQIVWKLETTSIPALNVTITNKQDKISSTTTLQYQVTEWKSGATITNQTITNQTITNVVWYMVTNALTNMSYSFTNKLKTNYIYAYPDLGVGDYRCWTRQELEDLIRDYLESKKGRTVY